MTRLVLAGGIELRLALIADGSADDVMRGAHLSAREAQRAAGLLGSSLQLLNGEPAPLATVLVLACNAELVQARAKTLDRLERVVINAAAPADAVNVNDPRVFHIAGTAKQQKELWQPDLERFGAAQLNARYRQEYQQGMTALAWAGWFAVKAAWEAALRARSTEVSTIARQLAASQFDGHKGRGLRFDPETRVLQ